jgi:two-component system response regulator HydG
MLKVLVVDDDQGLRFSVKENLAQSGQFEIDEAFDGINAIEKVRASNYNLVLLDVDMPRLDGLEALKLIKEHDPSIVVIVMTAYATIDNAVRAVKEGAYNYISKPVKGEELLALVEKALKAQSLISEVAASAPVLMEAGRKIIGNTAEMQKVFNIINRLSKVDTPVLVRGASGTGKELVARAIHFNSARKDQKFVAINCSAIPENLFESELFGHEKGSFTGASERKIGKFQFAEGGTLFLDELGDMPVLMQVKLLRVLQEKLFTPVGSNREIEANVRVIAATNRPLEEMIKEGKFREDLFYRLNVIPIFLPSLAERKNDLENLIQTFIKKFNKSHTRRVIGMSPEAVSVMKKYDWPGNIRELENVIEHAFILETANTLTLGSLPESVLIATGVSVSNLSASMIESDIDEDERDEVDASDEEPAEENIEMLSSMNGTALDFNKHKEAFEKEFIIKALKAFKGRINQTALHANIPKKTLLRKIEKYGINAKDYFETL